MVKQRHLTMPAMIGFITFMNMYPPLTTDMYLPALPEMGKYFEASEFLIGMTLTIYFLVFAVSIVIFGPLSDKYGRKPILMFGSIVYVIASVICATSFNIYMLLLGRFFQGVGSGAVLTVATALIKDCFRGRLMSKILAITQALGVIGPMAAPLIGGFLLRFTDWRGAFYLLIILGAVNLFLTSRLTETLPREKRYNGDILESLLLLTKVARNKSFMLTLIMFSVPMLAFMAYLSVSSFIYVEGFGLTAQEYSYFFAFSSGASVLGPIVYLKLKATITNARILHFALTLMLISGVAVLIPGHLGAWEFLISFLPFAMVGAIMRPFSMEILLNKVRENVGTASSMMNFVPNLCGSIGMALGTLPWGDFVTGLGIIMLAATGVAVLLSRFIGDI